MFLFDGFYRSKKNRLQRTHTAAATTLGLGKSVLIGGTALTALWILWSFFLPWLILPNMLDGGGGGGGVKLRLRHDPVDVMNFYDDPKCLSYTMGKPIENWDEKRQEWLKHHPSFAGDRVFMLTGSQPSPCKSPIGDHLQLRLFKNKVDYCRIHGYDIFYNNALLHPKMTSYWAKIPVVRAAMVAHPEAEWIFWVDSDAVITDVDFKPPMERYKDHNMVVDGWPFLIYENRSWSAVNTGVFLIRNCQWSMDFMEVWASMGPQTPDYEKWGQIVVKTLTDKTDPAIDDQSALVYLLLTEKDHKWGRKIYIENKYVLSGYWVTMVEFLDKIHEGYEKIEKGVRRHAEAVREHYAAIREARQAEGEVGWRPFVTHFTACKPCSGDHPGYTDEACRDGMEKALNFADNQVLRSYGFVRPDLLNASYVLPVV